MDELERTVMLMDEYTRQLEGKFKHLAEREKAAQTPQVGIFIFVDCTQFKEGTWLTGHIHPGQGSTRIYGCI